MHLNALTVVCCYLNTDIGYEIFLPSSSSETFCVTHLGIAYYFSGVRLVRKYFCSLYPETLQALADESEYVRDTALRAGQRIINLYADTAVSVFLPELERGLFDDNWRIRYSSIQLLGDLLYKISGVTGKMTTEGGEDDNFGTEHSTKVKNVENKFRKHSNCI